jgi:hypothetical protein
MRSTTQCITPRERCRRNSAHQAEHMRVKCAAARKIVLSETIAT